jgi:hypothetical protein
MVNAAFTKLTGYTFDESYGRNRVIGEIGCSGLALLSENVGGYSFRKELAG